MNTWTTRALGAVLAAGLPLAALAADGGALAQQITLAQAHAEMAAGADSLDMTHTHLHHVINCLVGEDGDGFDADEANPCNGMGAGALPDLADDSDVHAQLETAAADARTALDEDDQDAAQQTAKQIAQALGQAGVSTEEE